MKAVVIPVIGLLLSGCSAVRGGARAAMESSSPSANILGGVISAVCGSEETPQKQTSQSSLDEAEARWNKAAAPVIALHPDFEYVVYEVLGSMLDPETGDAQIRAAWDRERDKGPANAYRFAKLVIAQREASTVSGTETLQVTSDALGPGVGQDQYGRSVKYEVSNWPKNEPTENLRVTPDAHGPGIGQDQYGRPVTVSP